MVKEITNPLFGRLNLFYSQLQAVGNRVATMRADNIPHEEIDVELSYMGQLNSRLAEICHENHLNITKLLEQGVEAVAPRSVTTH